LYFCHKKAFKRRVLAICKKKKSYRNHILSSSLQSKGFDIDEEINNMMNGIPQDELDEYHCNISDDSNSDGIVRRGSSDSMNEGSNEKGNGEEEHERGDNENGRRNFHIMLKGRCVWQGVECELVDDVGLFIASGHVISCDPKEVVFDNQLGEDHVGVNILYCLNNISMVITIWKWPLAQTIVDRYSIRQLFVSYDECNIPTIDEEGKIVVRKKQYTFQKRM
jgi:hypothetical protein